MTVFDWPGLGGRARILVEDMASRGLSGYFTATEIDEQWSICCGAGRHDFVDPSWVRDELRLAGLKRGLRRLHRAEFDLVRRRTGLTRAVLYRIPTSEEAAQVAEKVSPMRRGAA